MKKLYLSVLAVSALLFGSCSDFLDVQPEGSAITNAYFTNDQQAIDAIDGLYKPLHKETVFGRDLFWEQGAACDIVWGRTRNFNSLATLSYTGDEEPLRNSFDTFYQVMSRANWIIKQLLDKETRTELSDVEKRSLGEAYFMRGMTHFLVAYRYGTDKQGVPFVRYEDFEGEYDNSIPPQQPTVMDNYRLIIEDMDSAIEYLPKFEEYTEDERGRAHQAAAVAYKAKVYAYWATWDESQWNNVITMVGLLETEYGRDLAQTFDELFSSDFADYWNAEYIWSIPSTGGVNGGGSDFPGVVLENKGWGVYNGWGQIKPTLDIYEEMAKDGAGNDRLVRSILEYNQEFQFFGETMRFASSSDLEAGFQVNKYMDPFKYANAIADGYVNPNGDWPTARVNFPLIRFAEMLLFRAEAYIMTNQPELALSDLNRIRERSNLTLLDHTPTMTDLYHERRCELAFEFTDHLFDLKRWHRSSNSEIKALAEKELNSRPRVRNYEDRTSPTSAFTIGYYADYPNKEPYQDYMMVFPYSPEQVTKSNGLLKQNEGY
ncbi:MAG TPA: RagB/SusD family nutrient uptake outer membrane protein [Candidatus Phocaeicola gallinarum]|uniref:RagB/SusD family nutrient uptake outer membrane protein n=1 Tax=Bacteroides caecicola TaxID=1462569 RepID=A0ABS2F9U3_9BACE|nr:RagB/SusD family nutrient uptake outer membrane protein [Bacteroides caecicola]MBM6806990.1 RagB/SusD family nutrient uptake outer membrane protein [Bacteroides caecicola]HJC96896.1 RagB/SusD family nutrient uptake outer membrane protein [Candidatus Phocaeicola gallinarum]